MKTAFYLFLLLIIALPIAIAHDNAAQKDAFVRVVSANPTTKTYTFTCLTEDSAPYVRDIFIRPDNGIAGDEPEEHIFHDVAANGQATYTFKQNSFYHVGCYIDYPHSTNTAMDWRGDLHIDLRGGAQWNPEIKVLSSDEKTVSLECVTSGTPTWEVLDAQTKQKSNLGNNKQITYTAPTHGLYDIFCTANGNTVGLPIEFFHQGDPYLPDTQGVPHPITSTWIRGTSPSPTNSDSCTHPVKDATVTCSRGSIMENLDQGSCRTVTCGDSSGSTKVIACDKPDGTPQYFEIYKQHQTGTFTDVCLDGTCIGNNGFVRSSNFGDCDTTTPTPTPPPSTDCATTVTQLPVSCSSGSVTQDTNSGSCRTVTCSNGGSNIKVMACNKPDGSAQYFEMYKQSQAGSQMEICFGNDCMSAEGFKRGSNYPVCGSTENPTPPPEDPTPPPSDTPDCISKVSQATVTCTRGTPQKLDQGSCITVTCMDTQGTTKVLACDKPDGAAQYFEMYKQTQSGLLNNVCIQGKCIGNEGYVRSAPYSECSGGTTSPPEPTPPPSTCATTVTELPIRCSAGTVTQDTNTGSCRTVTCSSGANSIKVMACNKPNSGAQYFELYKQSQVGNQLEICFGNDCISTEGFKRGSNYPVCGGSTQQPQTNNALAKPIWLEPELGIDINTFDFHIQVYPPEDGYTHIATDYEMYDAITNERVWSALRSNILTHIHNADGVFEGNLANNNRNLKNDHDYKLRARFYTSNNEVTQWSDWRNFHTKQQQTVETNNFIWDARDGYTVDLVASNINTPVNVVMAPNIYTHLPEGRRPLLYVTQLYGQIGMIRKDGSYALYADNLLNYETFGPLPGSGETGVDGLFVDEDTGDLIVSMAYADSTAASGFSGKVVRFHTNDNGDTYTSTTTLMPRLLMSPSHHLHTINRGPDGKLYMNTGDADQTTTKNPAYTNGKVLRFNEDGSIPSDNPVSGTYFWAGGFRNHFGGDWRPGTQEYWVTNNGPTSNDGIYRVTRGNIFGWFSDTVTGTWHLWPQTVAPVALVFNDGTSNFPSSTVGNMYVALSGSTYVEGGDPISKRIVEFDIGPNGEKLGEEVLVKYTGEGYGAPIGLAFGSDGLYFTDIYGESGFVAYGQSRGNIFRVRPGTQTGPPITEPTELTAGIGPAKWYPQGLTVVWECHAAGGSGNYRYDYIFGDGVAQYNVVEDDRMHTYPSEGTYTASCTVHDVGAGGSATASTPITLP